MHQCYLPAVSHHQHMPLLDPPTTHLSQIRGTCSDSPASLVPGQPSSISTSSLLAARMTSGPGMSTVTLTPCSPSMTCHLTMHDVSRHVTSACVGVWGGIHEVPNSWVESRTGTSSEHGCAKVVVCKTSLAGHNIPTCAHRVASDE